MIACCSKAIMAFLTLIMGSHNVFYMDTFMRRLPRTHSQFSCLENVKTQEEEEDDLFSIFFYIFSPKKQGSNNLIKLKNCFRSTPTRLVFFWTYCLEPQNFQIIQLSAFSSIVVGLHLLPYIDHTSSPCTSCFTNSLSRTITSNCFLHWF